MREQVSLTRLLRRLLCSYQPIGLLLAPAPIAVAVAIAAGFPMAVSMGPLAWPLGPLSAKLARASNRLERAARFALAEVN